MKKYCESIYKTERWKTREVLVGNIGVGGSNPVRIQSMTTSNTRDIDATVDQVMRLADAGCEIVRITVQGIKEAEACEQIKNNLIKKGYNTPLVADIHFFPPAAFRVIDFVDKVRINPGNFVDKRASFKQIDYDDDSYAKEIERIEEKFTPLVEKCKTLNKAMRIGTNHGSLSDRIMNRYGDTPRGMLESALEFARICVKNGYHNFIFSMKSSNPQVMIQAYRLLVAEMMTLNWNYPLHLGVTEAGEGEDGRVKSAMGIGTLLLDGLGDTIRVSLTEDPWLEIDPCKRLIQFAQSYEGQGIAPFQETFRTIDSIQRRPVTLPKNLALHRDGTVILSASQNNLEQSDFYRQIGTDGPLNQPKLKVSSPDGLVITDLHGRGTQTKKLAELKAIGISLYGKSENDGLVPILTLDEAMARKATLTQLNRFTVTPQPAPPFAVVICDEPSEKWEFLKNLRPALIFLKPSKERLHRARHFFEWLQTEGLDTPVILNFSYDCSQEDLVIRASAEIGALLCDGLGDGVWIEAPYEIEWLRTLSFGILQAARMRSSKTDFISCPSCGRTLFDLQEVSKRIRERTAHLPGVKIAIMGCIVNGPGEMADAHFGYVGSKPGMIDLYIGKECVEKDIPFSEGDDRLVELIKKEGRWADPEI